MGKAEKEQLNRALGSYLGTIHETLQILDRAADSSLEKLKWDDVVKMGEQVSKQATVVGMHFVGSALEVKALEENMASYFNILQGFLLHSYGSTVGAGPTLLTAVHAVVKQVVDASFKLWMDIVSSYGSNKKDKTYPLPQLVGAVWEACSALKKTPASNVTAIGRAITQAAVSMKDVLREMNELKQEADSTDEDDNNDDELANELGNDLSPEEMKIAQFTIQFASETLALIKELIRCISALVKQETSNTSSIFVDTLERLLKLCQAISLQVDELGASLYPPQELSTLMAASDTISTHTNTLHAELQTLNSSWDAFLQCHNRLKAAAAQLQSQLKSSSPDDLAPKIQSLTVTS